MKGSTNENGRAMGSILLTTTVAINKATTFIQSIKYTATSRAVGGIFMAGEIWSSGVNFFFEGNIGFSL